MLTDDSPGFTLVELLIGLVVALIVIGAMYSVYTVQQKSHHHQRLALQTQQNLRAAMVILEQELRMAGYDPEGSRQFGITDIRRYDIVGTRVDAAGQPALFYRSDVDEDGVFDANEQFAFRIRDHRGLGRVFLTLTIGGSGRQLLAENIQAVGFAYGIDVDRDGRGDNWAGGNHRIWAVDADNDNLLDTHLDANNDGHIDINDDIDGDGRITGADGGALNPPVQPSRIKAIRVWILAAGALPIKGFSDTRTFVVGDRVIRPAGDQLQRRLLESRIECRNL